MNAATVLKLTPNILSGVYCHRVYVELYNVQTFMSIAELFKKRYTYILCAHYAHLYFIWFTPIYFFKYMNFNSIQLWIVLNMYLSYFFVHSSNDAISQTS